MSKTIIFVNGLTPDLKAIQRHIEADDRIFCADGGTLHALALGLTPHYIVGDLDSVPPGLIQQMQAQGVAIQQHPTKKDSTDLELTLSLALEQGAKRILLVTALGGRLDQQLGNIMLLAHKRWASVRLGIAEGPEIAWLMRGPDKLSLEGHPGDTFSFVVLSSEVIGLTLTGVAWPLDAVQVPLGSSLTISNVFVETRMTVEIKTGIGLAIQELSEA